MNIFSVIALLVMIIIAILLIPQPLCSLWVALAIASIDLGVIGFMTLWGVNLISFFVCSPLYWLKSKVVESFLLSTKFQLS